MSLYNINNHYYNPSVFEVGIQDISAPDAGRDINGLMHTLKIGTKFTLKIEHWEMPIAEAQQIIQDMYVIKTVNGKTTYTPKQSFKVNFYNPIVGARETRTFYSGDKSLPVRMWGVDSSNNPTSRAWYAKLTFNLIEI